MTRKAVLLGLGIWLVYLALLAPSFYSWDGQGMLHVAISLVQHHSLTIPASLGVPGRNDQFYSMWYPLLSFLAIPFVYLGVVLSRLFHLPQPYTVEFCAVILSTVIAAGTAVATTLLTLRLGAPLRRAVFAGVVYAFSTIAITYSRNFYADPLLALFVTLGVFFVFRETDDWGAGVCCLLAILAKPTGFLLTVAFIAYFVAFRKKGVWRILIGGSAGAAVFLLWNYFCFGSPFKAGQPNFWTTSHISIAFLGLLFSPGVGLFVYCPVLLLALRRIESIRRQQLLILGLTLMFVCMHSLWGRWYASPWGPRFLFPIIPALCALAAVNSRIRIFAGLALLGLIIQLPTTFATPERYLELSLENGVTPTALVWNPVDAPVIRDWPNAFAQVKAASRTDVRTMRTYRPTAHTFDQARFFRIVPLWWWMLPVIGLSRWWGVLLSCLWLVTGAYLIRSACAEEQSSRPCGAAATASP